MTNTKRWLDELPLGSGERELLLVGKAARPAEGAMDANWQALCAALGTTAISGTFATSAAAASSAAPAAASAASAKVGASIAVGKAASAGLFVVAAKSLVLGVGIGLAVMGAATAVQHSSRSSALPASVTKPLSAQPARRPRSSAPQLPLPVATPPVATEAAPVASASGASAVLRAREPGVVSPPLPTPLGAVQPAVAASAASTDEKTASLARQARELAELKRLIDHGSATEALGRLDKNFSAGTPSVLSEERDALYVQALARAQRRDEARTFARQFLVRYPHSPYFETMRQLLTEK